MKSKFEQKESPIKKTTCLIFLMFFFTVFSQSSFAQLNLTKTEPEAKPPLEPQLMPEADGWLMKTILEYHSDIRDYVDYSAEKLDHWLIKRRLTREENATEFRIETSAYFKEGEAAQTFTGININLRLPNFEKYWQVKFTSYDQQATDRGVRRNYLRQGPQDQNYGTTFEFFREVSSIKFYFQPRIGLQDPLNVSQLISLRSESKNDLFEFYPRIDLFGRPDKGAGVFGSFNTQFKVTDKDVLTLVNEGEYEERMNQFTATQGFTVGRPVTDYASMSYSLIFVSNNRPSYHLDSFSISYAYGVVLYRKFIEAQIIPGASFAKTSNFTGRAFTNINLNFIF